MGAVVAVDVGGTFTDVVHFAGGRIHGQKVPTTPDQADAVVAASEGGPDDRFLHGTTTATNTLLEGRGARVALVTSPGYEDLIEIGRQDRPSLYDSAADRPEPLVAREDRIPADIAPPALASRIASSGVEAIAVGLIESHLDAGEERRLAAEVASLVDAPVVVAADISPEFREYERLATTALSAYVTPSVAGYLGSLDSALPMESRLVMTSSGGLIPFSRGSVLAGRLILSGPAGGVVAAAALGRHHGLEQILSFDMGGTSTDVSRISNGEVGVGRSHMVGGRINRVPSVPIRTIGAGGGSIGWVDSGGALRVGPQSAGSVPGPAAYGRGGTQPTVTDANLVCGHIPAELALGGRVQLDLDRSLAALSNLGEALGLTPESTASGMLEVADSHMEHALRSVSVEEGSDPREAVLVAFGGAGGLHASRLAKRLGIGTVMVPPLSGVFSALGLLLAVPRADASQTVMLPEGDDRYFQRARDIVADARSRFVETFSSAPDDVIRACDVRYVGQSHELEVESDGSWEDVRRRFERAHATRFGFSRPGEPIEVVNIRAAATGSSPLTWQDLPAVVGNAAPVSTGGIWLRGTLPAGFELPGPGLITEDNSVVLLGEADHLTVLDDGTLRISVG